MRVLVTRSADDAKPLTAALEARGHEVLQAPLFTIVPAQGDAEGLIGDLTGLQALLFTSANGVRAFAALTAARDLTVFAVGDATARAARDAGFRRIESAAGDVKDLAALVAARLRPSEGALFQGAASVLAGDLKGDLERAGFTLRRSVLYRAEPATALPAPVRAALERGEIDAALFFSPRSGKTFVRLLREGGLSADLRHCHALCLSEAVAGELRLCDWAGVEVAPSPDTESLLGRLDALSERLGAEMAAGATGQTERAESEQTTEIMADEKSTGDADAPSAAEPAPALAIIAAFGGIRPMAAKLGVAVSTVQGWRERAVIPAARHADILAAATRHGIDVDGAQLEASAQPPAAARRAASGEEAEKDEGEAAKPARDRGAADSPVSAASKASAASRATSAATTSSTATDDQAEAEPAAKTVPAEQTREAEKSESAAPPPPPALAPRPSSRGAWIGGFLLGVLVLAGGAAGAVYTRDLWLPYTGLIDPEAAGESEAVAGEESVDPAVVARLETELAGLSAGLQGLEGRLEALVTEEGEADAGSDALEALRVDLADLQGRLAALEASPPTGEGDAVFAGLDDIESRLAALEASVPSDEVAATAAALAALEARLADLESTPPEPAIDLAVLDRLTAQSESAAARAEDLAARAESVAARVDALEASAAAPTVSPDDLTALAARLDAAESALASQDEATEALRAAVADQAAAGEANASEASAGSALTLAVGQLREALRNADGFAAELAVLQALLAEDAELAALLAPLEGHAETGIPTHADLRREFPAAARAAAALGHGERADGWVSGVLRRVSKIVTLRPIGPVDGVDSGAVLARAEAHLKSGDLAGALSELAALDGEAVGAIAPWRARAEARLAADRAVAQLSAQAIAKLAGIEG